GLTRPAGHHLDVDARLARALVATGHEVEIFANCKLDDATVRRSAETGTRLTRVFRIDAHRKPEPGKDTLQAAREAARTIVEDLESVPDTDLWYWPTFTPVQLLAAVQAGRKTRTTAGVWYGPNPIFQYGAYCWAEAAGRALGKRIMIGAYHESI